MGRRPRFKGHDYCELQEAWGIKKSGDDGGDWDDDADIASIRKHITSAFLWDKNKLEDSVKKDMIRFIDALIKTKISNFDPVLKAMKKLEDFTFMQVFCTMLPHMWT